MYLENASPAIQEYAKRREQEFVELYESSADFREACNLIADATRKEVREITRILMQEIKRAKGQANE